ncbi:hypothetical protein MKEN_00430900 [Mycena kentingensis (nom. inval.)]|nr:hypothetical protein MKEN_00430900 [Mycena kentingensis (nom. inval.)]
MGNQFYEQQLRFLAIGCLVALVADRVLSARKRRDTSNDARDDRVEGGLNCFLLYPSHSRIAADWLQGPYVYSLYHDQYAFEEYWVAVLFVTGFLSGGLSAPLVGAWADSTGRKRLCLVFCATYTSACLCILVPSLPVLLFGRVLGGISTSILFSAFESWLISSANSHALPQSDLSRIMGRATLVNGIVATGAGVLSNQLVSSSGSFASPFLASGALLVVAWFVIRAMWTENFGSVSDETAATDPFQLGRLRLATRIVSNDLRLLVLGITQTCFEGSMYLFVFMWVPALQEYSLMGQLPLGYIFSSFMISMMLGSLLYTYIAAASTESTLLTHAKLSSIVCAVAAFALALAVSQHDDRARFYAFCLFEACVGMYYPVQGMLRGALISNDQRATLSALFRVPLNIFVVVSLLTGVGHAGARGAVLSACSVMLAVASVLTGLFVVEKVDGSVAARL